MNGTHQVHFQRPPPVARVDILEWADGTDHAGTVNEHINPREFCFHLLNGRFDLLPIRYIEAVKTGERFTSMLVVDWRLGLFRMVGQRQARRIVKKPLRDRAAYRT